VFRRTAALIEVAVTLVFAAWLLDTWSGGGLTRWAKAWWADLAAPRMTPADVAALSNAVVAEAIGITRQAAREV